MTASSAPNPTDHDLARALGMSTAEPRETLLRTVADHCAKLDLYRRREGESARVIADLTAPALELLNGILRSAGWTKPSNTAPAARDRLIGLLCAKGEEMANAQSHAYEVGQESTLKDVARLLGCAPTLPAIEAAIAARPATASVHGGHANVQNGRNDGPRGHAPSEKPAVAVGQRYRDPGDGMIGIVTDDHGDGCWYVQWPGGGRSLRRGEEIRTWTLLDDRPLSPDILTSLPPDELAKVPAPTRAEIDEALRQGKAERDAAARIAICDCCKNGRSCESAKAGVKAEVLHGIVVHHILGGARKDGPDPDRLRRDIEANRAVATGQDEGKQRRIADPWEPIGSGVVGGD